LVLNFFLYWIKTIQTGIPLRAWDILGCDGFLLTNFQQELCDFFIPGEDFVYYESPADAIEKAAYFFSHDRERQEIAHYAFEKNSCFPHFSSLGSKYV